MLNRTGCQNSYNHNVRIGNWNEDKELEQLKMKEYQYRKSTGQLLVHQVQSHLNQSLTEVPLTHSKDGNIHIGDSVMLYSVMTEGVLSVDTSTKIVAADEGYAVTSSTLTQAPVARNVFKILPYGENVKDGDVLKLGQPFRLETNEKINVKGLLQSQPVSSMSFSKVTRNQEVTVTPVQTSYDTVWVAQYKDTNHRFEMEGQPVPANAEVVLVHAATKSALASQKADVHNDFGKEYEVCAHSNISLFKKQGLYQEKHGLTTTDIPVRAETTVNHWAFLTASVAPEPEQQPE
jgi:hypothetical protein